MLLNGGELDGAVILGRKTVELMMANHLGQLSPPVNEFNDGEGFGLGGYVVLDPARRGQLGFVGQFGWSGAAATWFLIDPQEELVAILMMQHLPRGLPRDPPRPGRPFNNLVYQALVPGEKIEGKLSVQTRAAPLVPPDFSPGTTHKRQDHLQHDARARRQAHDARTMRVDALSAPNILASNSDAASATLG